MSQAATKKQRKMALFACAIVSPGIFFYLYSSYWFKERFRTVDYDYSAWLYVALAGICLLCNAVIIKLIYTNSSNQEKFILWLKAILLSGILVAGLAVIIFVAFILRLVFGPKIGG